MSRPNIVVVFTDEQAAKTMAAYGNTQIETPNMDRLARESIVFENAYVTQPVCTPSRATIMTGLYPHTNGCTENNQTLPEKMLCFPELADFQGYKIAYHGKWHLGDEIFAQHGFDEWISVDDGYRKYFTESRDMQQHSTYHQHLIENGFTPDKQAADGYESFSRKFCCRLPEPFTKASYVGDEASRFIRENTENSFILFVNFFEPHMPFFGPRDSQYDPDSIPLPENFSHELSDKQPLKTRLFQQGYPEYGHKVARHFPFELKTEADWKRLIGNYWGAVSHVDTNVGKILDALERNGLQDNTIVVFTSDHGDMMGSHQLVAKCVMFEEATRVPLLVKIPGIEKKIIHDNVSQIDLVPTLLEAMGKGIPDHLEGYSWMPFLTGGGPLQERNVFIEWSGMNNGFGDVLGSVSILDCWKEGYDEDRIKAAMGDPVRTIITPDRWKYNKSTIGEDELYNLHDDPGETVNVAGGPQYAQFMKDLTDKIKAWQKRTYDNVVWADE